MERWWLRFPQTFAEEIAAYEAAGLEARVDPKEQELHARVVIRGVVHIRADEPVEFVVVYPDSFPFLRPQVFLPNHKLGRHQNPLEGNVCVFGRSSANWVPSMTGASLVLELPRVRALLDGDPAELQAAEEPQGEPVSTYYNYNRIGGVIVPAAALDAELPERGSLELTSPDLDWLVDLTEGGLGLISRVLDGKGRLLAEADEPLLRRFRGRGIRVPWIRLTAAPRLSSALDFVKYIQEKHEAVWRGGLRRRGGRDLAILGITFSEEVTHGAYGPTWLFCVAVYEGPKRKRVLRRAALLRGMRYSPQDLGERIAEVSDLRGLAVGIIGVGALGSAVAHELARAQVGRLSLADRDYVDPGSTVRWWAGLSASGRNKVDVLKERILLDYPYVKVDSHPIAIGQVALSASQTTEASAVADWLRKVDVIIDASAEDNVTLLCDYLAHEELLPLIVVYGWDGYGGVVARIIPKETGCFMCLEYTIRGGDIPAPTAATHRARLTVQPRGCDDPTFVAVGTELTPLAVEAVRLLLATTCSGREGGYPSAPYDVMVLRLRNEDGSLRSHPEWETFPLRPHPSCARCANDAQ